jgi:hypothetical protein
MVQVAHEFMSCRCDAQVRVEILSGPPIFGGERCSLDVCFVGVFVLI